MKLLKNIFIQLDKIVGQALFIISISCFACLFLVISLNVFVRSFPIFSMRWSGDIIELLFVWLVFMGTAAIWRNNEHFSVPWLKAKFQESKNIGQVITIICDLLSLLFLVIMGYYGLKLTLLANDITFTLHISKRFLYICIPIAGIIMISYTIYNIIKHIQIILYSQDKRG